MHRNITQSSSVSKFDGPATRYNYEEAFGVCPETNPLEFKRRLRDLRNNFSSREIAEITGVHKTSIDRLFRKFHINSTNRMNIQHGGEYDMFMSRTIDYKNDKKQGLPAAIQHAAEIKKMTVEEFLQANKEGRV